MRLVDADELKKNGYRLVHVDELKPNTNCKSWADIPTAFDVVQVLTDLATEKEYSYADFEEYVRETNPVLDVEYDDLFHRGLERAIKIVRKGGVE